MVEGKGYYGGRPSAGVVPYGRIFIARIEDILQEDVVIVSCDAMLPCNEPTYCYVRNPMTPIVSPPFATHDDIWEAIYGY